MKKIVSLLLAACVLVGAAVSLVGCGAPEDAGAEISVYLGGELYDFDPSDYYVSDNAEQVMSLLYEPLFRLDKKGNLEYAAAKKYSVNEEERQIVIELRESYWSDKSEVVAADFIFAWRDIILEPNTPNPAAALLYDIENAVHIKSGEKSIYSFGAVATGEQELTITYREGADYEQLLKNLSSVALSPLRETVVTAQSKTFWSKSAVTAVTNGPFKFERLDNELGVFTLTRNVGYHQPLDEENYTKNVNPAALVPFVSEEGKLMNVSYADIEAKAVFYMSDAPLADRAANKENAISEDALSTYTYVFNTDNPLFKNVKVRQALSLALDREAIAEAVVFGTAANGFLTSEVAKSIYGKKVESRIATSESMIDAKALLAEVNFADVSKSFTLTVNDDEESLKIAELAKAAWTELGFNVTVDAVSSVVNEVFNTGTGSNMSITDSAIQSVVKDASYGNRKFDIIAVDWQMYSADAFVALASLTTHMNGNGRDFSTGANRTSIGGWVNLDYDSAMNRAFNARTEEERKAALKEAESILLAECPVIPVLHNQKFMFVNDDLSKVKMDFYGNASFVDAAQKNYHKYLRTED